MHEFIRWLSVAEMCAAERLNRTYWTINGQFAIITVHVRTVARARLDRRREKKKNNMDIKNKFENWEIETLRALEQTAISILNGSCRCVCFAKEWIHACRGDSRCMHGRIRVESFESYINIVKYHFDYCFESTFFLARMLFASIIVIMIILLLLI